jgi:hypothetical protein
MTRKDYRLIANALKALQAPHNDTDTLGNVAYSLADVLQYDNPRFNRAKFLEACGVK